MNLPEYQAIGFSCFKTSAFPHLRGPSTAAVTVSRGTATVEKAVPGP